MAELDWFSGSLQGDTEAGGAALTEASAAACLPPLPACLPWAQSSSTVLLIAPGIPHSIAPCAQVFTAVNSILGTSECFDKCSIKAPQPSGTPWAVSL